MHALRLDALSASQLTELDHAYRAHPDSRLRIRALMVRLAAERRMVRSRPCSVVRLDVSCCSICRPTTYSPWLNPIEMLWRHFRREVTHRELFQTVQALLTATRDFFNRYNCTPDRVLSIIGAHPA